MAGRRSGTGRVMTTTGDITEREIAMIYDQPPPYESLDFGNSVFDNSTPSSSNNNTIVKNDQFSFNPALFCPPPPPPPYRPHPQHNQSYPYNISSRHPHAVVDFNARRSRCPGRAVRQTTTPLNGSIGSINPSNYSLNRESDRMVLSNRRKAMFGLSFCIVGIILIVVVTLLQKYA